MKLTKEEARKLNQVVAEGLRRGAEFMGVATVSDLQKAAQENNLAHWNMLFDLSDRLRSVETNSSIDDK
ncbi:MAG: hypothetical protein CMP95_02800 [Gammaproteobacteria bacterium]|nr:hypothetical protein [Gammaproteobacteria bacterium]|tara:strand:+ start:23290 stop:23496 length:207 start_codon:yes stop_codon:yes gene_type:complete